MQIQSPLTNLAQSFMGLVGPSPSMAATVGGQSYAPSQQSLLSTLGQSQSSLNPVVILGRILESVIGQVLSFAFGLITKLSSANATTAVPAAQTAVATPATGTQETNWLGTIMDIGKSLWGPLTSLFGGGSGIGNTIVKTASKVGGLFAGIL